MGGAESTGALHVDVESHNLQTGDEIQGVVHLLVKSPTPANELVLYFKGKEKTHWAVRRKEKNLITGMTHNVTYTYGGHKDIIKHRFPIFVFAEQMVQPGQYSFPFAIRTPADIPSTFDYRPPYNSFLDAGPTIAAISYKLIAKIEGHEAKVDKGKTHVNMTRPMLVQAVSVHDEHVANISTWCCFSKGKVKVKADFNKNAFIPGDQAIVTVDVDNQESKLEGTALVASLTRVIRLKDETGRSHVVNSTINQVRLEEAVAAGSHMAAVTKKTLQLAIPNDETVAKTSTVQGQLVECEWFLSGEIVMDGCCMCCGDTPRISKPMAIYPPQLQQTPPPVVPEGWNPTVMPAMQFVATVDMSAPKPSAPREE